MWDKEENCRIVYPQIDKGIPAWTSDVHWAATHGAGANAHGAAKSETESTTGRRTATDALGAEPPARMHTTGVMIANSAPSAEQRARMYTTGRQTATAAANAARRVR